MGLNPELHVSYKVPKTVYYLKDHLGSTRVVVDEDGDVVESYDYFPFGLASRTSGGSTIYKFTEKELDNETDFYYFGARYYDAEVGRFTSVDPLAEKYPSLSPYNYVANNPLRNYDPDGRKIRFATGTSSQFKREFAKTIQYLNMHKISGLVARLEKVETVVFIKEGKSLNDFYYDPSTKTIVYNPYSGLKTTSGGKQTPALGFLHEAAHALQDVTNPEQLAKDVKTPDPQYGNKEERRVIEEVETPAAIKAGEGTRSDHSGTPYRVKDPTSTEEVKDED